MLRQQSSPTNRTWERPNLRAIRSTASAGGVEHQIVDQSAAAG